MAKSATNWNKFVTALYRKKHSQNSSYKFKNALKEASKLYKKGKHGGGMTDDLSNAVEMNETPSSPTSTMPMSGGKSRRRRRHSKKTKRHRRR